MHALSSHQNVSLTNKDLPEIKWQKKKKMWAALNKCQHCLKNKKKLLLFLSHLHVNPCTPQSIVIKSPKWQKIKRNKEEQIKERLERGRAKREEGNNRESKHNNIPKWRGKCCSAHFINQTVNFTQEAKPKSNLKQTQRSTQGQAPRSSLLSSSPLGYYSSDRRPPPSSSDSPLLFICL